MSIELVSIVIGTAALTALHPCSIGVLLLLLSSALGKKTATHKLLRLGGVYIAAIFAVTLLAGLGLVFVFSQVPLAIIEYLLLLVGCIVIVAGLVEIKDFFWYGKGFSLQIPQYVAAKIHTWTKNQTVLGSIVLGALTAGFLLPCIGASYLAIITMLSINGNWHTSVLVILYNLVFVSPLIVILLLADGKTTVSKVKRWKQTYKGYVRLAVGFVLIGLGWLLLLLANGTINFG